MLYPAELRGRNCSCLKTRDSLYHETMIAIQHGIPDPLTRRRSMAAIAALAVVVAGIAPAAGQPCSPQDGERVVISGAADWRTLETESGERLTPSGIAKDAVRPSVLGKLAAVPGDVHEALRPGLEREAVLRTFVDHGVVHRQNAGLFHGGPADLGKGHRDGRGGVEPGLAVALGVAGRLAARRPDITMEMVEAFLHNMYRRDGDFVFTVTRDFVRNCETPILVLPDDIPAHPYEVAMEAAMLAPNAEVSLYPWKTPADRVPLAVRHIRSFLRAHRPT